MIPAYPGASDTLSQNNDIKNKSSPVDSARLISGQLVSPPVGVKCENVKYEKLYVLREIAYAEGERM